MIKPATTREQLQGFDAKDALRELREARLRMTLHNGEMKRAADTLQRFKKDGRGVWGTPSAEVLAYCEEYAKGEDYGARSK